MATDPSRIAHIFGIVAALSVCGRWAVLAIWLVLATGSVGLALTTLGINTDTTDMLSPELQFRKQFSAYRAAFPQGKGSLVVFVKGPTGDLTGVAARRLSNALRRRPATFRTVFDLQGDEFFRRNGLLYLKIKDLEALSERLTEAQPILGLFVKQPNIAGLFSALETVLQNTGGSRLPADRLAALLNSLSAALEAAAKGERRPVDWSKILGGFGTGRTAVIVTQPVLDFASLSPARQAMNQVRAIAKDHLGLTPAEGYSVRLTGSAAISSEEISSVLLGASQAGLLSLLLVVILLFAGFRQPWSILSVVLTLMTGLAVTLGFVAVALGELNLISVAFAVLFIGLGVDFGIHYALRVTEFAEADDRFARAARQVGPALGLAAAAAALAFLAFLFTDYRGVAELGLIAAVGMGVALLGCLTMLPALQSLRPVRRVGGVAHVPVRLSWIGDKVIIGVALVLALAALAAAPFATFDRNPLNLKDPGAESVKTAVSLINHPRYGLTPIQVLATTRARATEFAARLRKLPEVRSVRTIDSFVTGNQEDKREIIDELGLLLTPMFLSHSAFRFPDKPFRTKALLPSVDEARHRIKALQAAADRAAETVSPSPLKTAVRRFAEALKLFAEQSLDKSALVALNSGLTHGLVLRLRALALGLKPDEISLATLPKDLRRRYVSPAGLYKVEVLPRQNLQDNRALKAFVAAVQRIAPNATGAPVVELRAGNAVVDAFLLATALAAVFIVVLLFVVRRRVLDVFLVLTPAALAGLLTLGTAVLLDRSFNFANIIALPLLIGLGAAGGIHIVSRWRAGGGHALQSTTPRAILFSAITTVASFGTLAVSPHRGTASMGELLMIAIGWSLICMLIVLPAALRLLIRTKTNG